MDDRELLILNPEPFVWQHKDSKIALPYTVSKFFFDIDMGYFQIKEGRGGSGARRFPYLIENITIKVGNGAIEGPFPSDVALLVRLRQLNYPGFIEMVNAMGLISLDANNILAIGSDGLLYVPNGGEASTTYIADGTNTTVTGSGTFIDPYQINAEGGGSENLQQGAGIVLDDSTPGTVIISANGLEYRDDGNGFGWRLIGKNPANYGMLGDGAVDLSDSQEPGNYGATGQNAFATGQGNVAEGSFSSVFGTGNNSYGYSSFTEGLQNNNTSQAGHVEGQNNNADNHIAIHIEGRNNTATSDQAHVEGISNAASGQNSHVEGEQNIATAANSHVGGIGNQSDTFAETAIGQYGTVSPSFGSNYEPTDRQFNVGVGYVNDETSETILRDGLSVFKSGLVTAPELTNDLIDAGGDKTLTTKDWVLENAGGGSTPTELTAVPSPTDVVINSSTQLGSGATIGLTDGTNAGLLSPAEKTKLAGIATGATANTGTVTSVTGVSGETTVATGTTTPVIGIASAYTAARDAVANAKVENNLTASTTVAPSKTAVIGGLALKEDVANKATTMTGNTTSNILYLTAKAVYDWAIGLFAPIDNPTFTGTVTIPNGGLSITGGSGQNMITGNGSPQNIAAQVRSSILTAPTLVNTPIVTNNTIQVAFGNAQGQINFLKMLNVVQSVSTYALPITNNQIYVTHTGTTATYTFPTLANGTGIQYTIINMGSGTITLNSNAGGSDIYDSGTSSASVTVLAGQTAVIYGNGTKFVIL